MVLELSILKDLALILASMLLVVPRSEARGLLLEVHLESKFWGGDLKFVVRLLEMPLFLRLLVLPGMLAPILIALSVLSGMPEYDKEAGSSFGVAHSFSELVLVVLSGLPISVASFLFFLRVKASRVLFVLGWFLVCLSPLFLSAMRSSTENGIELLANSLLGIVIAVYLGFSREVSCYLGNRKCPRSDA